MKTTLDLRGNWRDLLRDKLRAVGYDDVDTIPEDKIEFAYFNLLRRLPTPSPRRVHVAPTLSCPDHVRTGYDAVVGKMKQGDNLRPHLSTLLAKLDFNDALLNDWGILHLHLGTAPHPSKSGFLSRTSELLYAYFVGEDVYLLDVRDHGSFADKELLEVLSTAWPHLTETSKLTSVLPSGFDPTPDELKTLRSKGINMPLNMGGAVHVGPGGGYATSGMSLQVVREADRWASSICDAERLLREQKSDLEDGYRSAGQDPPDELKLSLLWQKNVLVVASQDNVIKEELLALGTPRLP